MSSYSVNYEDNCGHEENNTGLETTNFHSEDLDVIIENNEYNDETQSESNDSQEQDISQFDSTEIEAMFENITKNKKSVFGKCLTDPLLGKHYQEKSNSLNTLVTLKPVLETSLSYIPVYFHLKVQTIDKKIERLNTPPVLRNKSNRNLNFLDVFRQVNRKSKKFDKGKSIADTITALKDVK